MENASRGYFNQQTNSIVYFKNLESKGTTASLLIITLHEPNKRWLLWQT